MKKNNFTLIYFLLTTILSFGEGFLKITSLTFGIMVFTFSSSAQIWPPENMQGDGTESNPWQITTPKELAILADYINAENGNNTAGKYYKLMNNIDLSEYENWKPIGGHLMYGWSTCFQGNFNGNGKIIQNLTIKRPTEKQIGLFGYIYCAVIENLGVENCNVCGKGYVGGLAGRTGYSIINNCYVSGDVDGRGDLTEYVGGLTGYNDYPTITNCYAVCNVKGFHLVGGLVGNVYGPGSTISTSFSAGTVTADFEKCGGLVGGITNGVVIRNCIAVNESVIVNSNTMDISRIVGFNYQSDCYNNYALNTMVVQNSSGNITIIDGLNTKAGMGIDMELLQNIDFYASTGNWYNEAWDIISPTSVWRICDGAGLPFLRWQKIGCNIFTINAIPNNPAWGDITGSDSYEEGSTATLIATPTTNYRLVKWTEAGTEVCADPIYSFTVDRDRSLVAIFEEVVGISDFSLSSVKVYPNPAFSAVTIETNNFSKVEIYNTFGQLLQVAATKVIDVSSYNSGVYFFKVFDMEGNSVAKRVAVVR